MALFKDVSRKLICENLRYIMIKNGIKTQKELAEIIGVTPVMLHHVIVGEQYPSVYPFLAGIHTQVRSIPGYSGYTSGPW